MLPLIPLALSLAPELGRWLFGPAAGAATAAVAEAVQAATGTSDADVAQAVVARDPKAAADLRLALAKLAAEAEAAARAADLADLQAHLADVAGARAQTQALAASGSRIAFGAPALSAVILMAFATMLFVVLTRAIPDGSGPLANVLLGSLAAMATQVANYWLGSSAGSAAKTELLANSVPAHIARFAEAAGLPTAAAGAPATPRSPA